MVCQSIVCWSALSNREVLFAPMLAGEGGLLGFPENLSGTSLSWLLSNSSSRLGCNISTEEQILRYDGSFEFGLFFGKFRNLAR